MFVLCNLLYKEVFISVLRDGLSNGFHYKVDLFPFEALGLPNVSVMTLMKISTLQQLTRS